MQSPGLTFLQNRLHLESRAEVQRESLRKFLYDDRGRLRIIRAFAGPAPRDLAALRRVFICRDLSSSRFTSVREILVRRDPFSATAHQYRPRRVKGQSGNTRGSNSDLRYWILFEGCYTHLQRVLSFVRERRLCRRFLTEGRNALRALMR